MDIITGSREDLIEMLNTAIKQGKKIKRNTDRIAMYNYVGNLYSALNVNDYEDYPVNYTDWFLTKKNYTKFLKEVGIMGRQFGSHFVQHKEFHNDYLHDVLSFYEGKMQELATVPKYKESKYLGKEKFFEILFGFLSKYGLEKEFREFLNKKRIFFKVRENKNDDYLGLTVFNSIDRDTAILIAHADYDFDTLFTLIHEFGHVIDLSFFKGDNISQVSIDYAYKSYYPEVYSRLLERLFIHYLVEEDIVKELGIDKYIECMLIGHDFFISAYMYSLLDDRHFLGSDGLSITDDEFYNEVVKSFKSDKFVKEFIKEEKLCFGSDMVYTYGDLLSTHLLEPVLADGLDCIEMRQFMDVRTDSFDPEFLIKNGYDVKHYEKVFSKEVDLCKK